MGGPRLPVFTSLCVCVWACGHVGMHGVFVGCGVMDDIFAYKFQLSATLKTNEVNMWTETFATLVAVVLASPFPTVYVIMSMRMILRTMEKNP